MTEQQAREAERKAIAEWLRSMTLCGAFPNYKPFASIAFQIERGEHLKGKE